MSFYSLDSFPKDKVENLGELCSRIPGVEEMRCTLPDREWLSDFCICLVRYTPSRDFPVLVQSCPNQNYRDNPAVKDFLIELVRVAGVQKFYEGIAGHNIKPLDVSLLR